MIVIPPVNHQTKSCDDSFVKMTSSKIIEMAKATLKYIKDYRDSATKAVFDNEKQYIMNGFWHKLFKRPEPTDEEVWASVNRCGGDVIHFPETFFINLRYSKNEDAAHRLLNAAQHADEIYISTKDLRRLCIYTQ